MKKKRKTTTLSFISALVHPIECNEKTNERTKQLQNSKQNGLLSAALIKKKQMLGYKNINQTVN